MILSDVDNAILNRALIAASHEMGAKLIRSAHSPIVREAQDCSAALTDPKGRAPWYNGTGVMLYVSGMMVAAVALRMMGAG